jgi:hypothetical protein
MMRAAQRPPFVFAAETALDFVLKGRGFKPRREFSKIKCGFNR